MGVVHFSGLEESVESSNNKESAAAVNDLVVEPVQYNVSGLAFVSGNSAIPYAFE